MSREKETLHTIEETKTALKGKDTNVPSNNLIDRQAAISIPLTPKGLRKYQTCNLDDAYDEGWGDYQACVSQLPPARPEPYLDSIVSEIEKTISETRESGKHHDIKVRANGEMICFGLQLALEIIEDKRNERHDIQTNGD